MLDTVKFTKFKAAAVQLAPVYLNAQSTAEKACDVIREAAKNGAQLVVFPEVFLSGYPYWVWITDPITCSPWFERLIKASVFVPGPEISMICEAAAANNVLVIIGVNERSRISLGTLYNTLVFISPEGKIMGKHRKLVPTWAEKLIWANGDGSSLKVYNTKLGPIGGLACGENTNTLARFALLAQGELIHAASYISLPVAPADYDMAEAIKLRASAHSFEGKLFSIVATSTISKEIIAEMEKIRPDVKDLFDRKSSAFSGIIGPDGRVVGKPLIDSEGIVYAEIDLNKCIQPKQMHDIVGHYNRFDIFDLRVNNRPLTPISFSSDNVDTAPPSYELQLKGSKNKNLK